MEHHYIFFFFNDTATTEIYTLSLHDALPICRSTAPDRRARPTPTRPARATETAAASRAMGWGGRAATGCARSCPWRRRDRKSTRLNSSHANISYAVFCLKKKKYNLSYISYVD